MVSSNYMVGLCVGGVMVGRVVWCGVWFCVLSWCGDVGGCSVSCRVCGNCGLCSVVLFEVF